MPRLPLFPTLLVGLAVVIMVMLGIWQLQRATWKDGLIARYAAAPEQAAPVPWPQSDAAMEAALFRTSAFTCDRVLAVRQTAGTAFNGAKGWEHVARCAIDGTNREAEVALGWSTRPEAPRWTGGPVRGLIAPGGKLILDRPVPPLRALARPDPNDLPNNHLAYAGQWFFFALTALVIYLLALRGRRKV